MSQESISFDRSVSSGTTPGDRDLLEKAAKAAGVELDWDVPPKSPPWRMTGEGDARGPASQWNPLWDDGDALRLITQLGLEIRFGDEKAIVFYNRPWRAEEPLGKDRAAAVRRAIVRAAARLGADTEGTK